MSFIKTNKVNKSQLLLIFALVLYVASAIAYECTASTARISTLAIYFLFIVGGYYIFTKQIMHFSAYTLCTMVFALYVFIMYIPMLFSATPKAAQASYHVMYVNFTCMILCVIVYMLIYHNPSLVKWVLIGSILGSFILTYRVVSLYENIGAMLEYASDTDLGEHRIGVEIINANLLGLYMSNAVLCALILRVSVKNKGIPVKLCLVFLIIIFVAMALLAGSKKATVFVLAGVIAMAVFMSKGQSSSKRLAILATGLIVFALIIWAIMSFDFFATLRMRIEALFSTFSGESVSQTDQTRAQYITDGLDAFWRSPILGNGTGYSYNLFGTYSHNNFVELLMNYGIVGFLLHYLPFVMLIFKMYKKTKSKDVYSIYFLVYTIILVFMGFALVSYYERVMQLIIAAAWGYCDSNKMEMISNED